MSSPWLEPVPVEVPAELYEAVGGHRLIAETLVRRGIHTAEAARAFLDSDVYHPASPFDLPDMKRGVERAAQAIRSGEAVLIWGDFDVDGQTATTLLVSVFAKLGLAVSYYIPDRQREGHGIHPEKLQQLISELKLKLVITCDTGISAHEAVSLANAHGVDVVITDHHQLPDALPEAYACINPQRVEEDHPLATLPGVGCAYKFAEALAQTFGQPETLAHDELDLVALGIVADLAVQKADTRYLLQRGLAQLRQTRRRGLETLFRIAGLTPESINETDIAFTVAPRLNSLGRLGDANQAVEFLTTPDRMHAEIIANRLETLNNERKLLERQVFDSAVKQIEQDPTLLKHPVLVLWHSGWPTGVLGIAANRLVEAYRRPAILLNVDNDGVAHGSARSVDGLDITEAMSSCSQYLMTYGGHTMAAGISLSTDNLAAFRRCLGQFVQQKTPVDASKLNHADGTLSLAELSLDFVRDLQRLAPFGVGNPPLTFTTHHVRVVDQKPLGRDEKHLRWIVMDETGETREVTRWRTSVDETPGGVIDLLFSLREDHFKGKHTLLIEYRDSSPAEIEDNDSFSGQVEMIDWRDADHKVEKLRTFLTEQDAVVWCEGERLAGLLTRSRNELSSAKNLILWTIPPSRSAMRQIITQVQPHKIIVTGVMPLIDELEPLLKHIAGVIRYAVRKYDGRLDIRKVAASIAHTTDFVLAALNWFAARGDIVVVAHNEEENSITVELADAQKDEVKQAEYFARLQQFAEEVNAYRSYFMRAPLEKIIEG